MRVRAFALSALCATAAHAQVPTSAPPPHDSGLPAPAVWERGVSRPFVAATLELGWTYVRPELAVGFGRPFHRWMGLDLKPLVTTTGAGFYGGLRGSVPFLDLRAGVRHFEPFEHTLLREAEHHQRAELDTPSGPEPEPYSIESELSGSIAVPGGGPFWLAGIYYVSNVQQGFHLYEESLKVIIDPPWVFRLRAGYAWRFGPGDAVSLGVAEEIIENPGRPGYVIRAGVIGRVAITEHLDAQLSLLPVIHSPDSIGLAGADFGHLGVRWRWATAGAKRRRR
ncbi:MAG: hypothetical protein HYZ29_20050 [Myxococcales bacterium]|nr:hypothetical protein [Myxococcales bacterium]